MAPPALQFVKPRDGEVIKGDALEIEVEATGSRQVADVQIRIDGARANRSAEGTRSRARGSSQRFGGAFSLAPNETAFRIQAQAVYADGTKSPQGEVRVTRVLEAPKPERLLALCVGVSDYRDPAVQDLKYAHRDAEGLAQELGKQRRNYASTRVTALTNERATRAAIQQGLDGLVAEATKSDTVILFFAGHGTTSGPRSFYFTPYDFKEGDATTALAWTEVVQRLARLSEKSKRVLVLLDACRSGSTANNEELAKVALTANAGVMLLASCKGSETSLELGKPLEHGAFTLAVLEAMTGRASGSADSPVTMLDLFVYVVRRVRELTKNQQNPHVPYLFDFDTDAVLVAN
jgi:hypothetical protein